MLVDPKFSHNNPIIGIVAAMHGGPVIPERINKGMYIAGHWNVGDMTVNIRDRWKEKDWVTHDISVPESGVCDSPEQLMKKVDFESIPEPVFISFVRISRDEQPLQGGWRWHKWGEYIGDHEPMHEYLHDERDIFEVYTFSVHELKS